MLNLIRAELLKLSRRPLTWVLFGVFLFMLLFQLLTQFLVANLGALIGIDQQSPLAAQIDEMRRRTIFPGLIGAVLGQVNGIGGIFAVIFAAGAMGSEYSWGTLRTQLMRTPSRTRYLFAKIVAVMGMLAAATLITLIVGVLVGGVLALLIGRPGTLSAAELLAVIPASLRALYVLLPYVLLTISLAILGRSLIVGLAGGLFYLVFEAGFGALATLQILGGLFQAIYNLMPQQNITTLVIENSHAFGLRPETIAPITLEQLPSPLQAVLVIAVYCAGFVGTAVSILRRRDITGPQ
jgi:ABC-type transport system involved in multi-copper enzyme maturation permease subunit